MFAILIGFFCFLRKSNLTVESDSLFDTTKMIRRSDIRVDRTEYVLWVRIRRTKTIQSGDRELWIPIHGQRDHILDIIVWYDTMIIPTKRQHLERNRHNYLPIGTLKCVDVSNNAYVDENGMKWVRSSFLKSLYHDPCTYYKFTSVDEKNGSSAEALVLKSDFNLGVYEFIVGELPYMATYNYCDSSVSSFWHTMLDVMPHYIYGGDYRFEP